MHEHSAFVTLTYDEENLPKDNSLNPKEFQKWIKRLRKEYSPKKLRYFGVGEYGDKSDRPHYHAILYGVEPCWKGQSMFDKEGQCCPPCDRISKTWGKGLVFIGTVTPDSAGYCCGYVTKKMTSEKTDFQKKYLKGRNPEFARMSLRPGIGTEAIHHFVEKSLPYGKDVLKDGKDVLTVIRIAGKKLPIGRYLRGKIREKIGETKEVSPEAMAEYAKTLQEVFREAYVRPEYKNKTLAMIHADLIAGKVASIEKKYSMNKERKL